MKTFDLPVEIKKATGEVVYTFQGVLVLSQMAINPREVKPADGEIYECPSDAADALFDGDDLFWENHECGEYVTYNGKRFFFVDREDFPK